MCDAQQLCSCLLAEILHPYIPLLATPDSELDATQRAVLCGRGNQKDRQRWLMSFS